MQSAPSAWIVMTSMPHEDSDEVIDGQVIDEAEVEYKEEECDTDARGLSNIRPGSKLCWEHMNDCQILIQRHYSQQKTRTTLSTRSGRMVRMVSKTKTKARSTQISKPI